VESDRGGWLELFAVEGGQNADDIIRAGRGLYDTGATILSATISEDIGHVSILLVNRFHKLSDHQRHTLYPLDLLLRTNELPLQAPVVKAPISPMPSL